mmetsp:Transcript_65297/g.181056  ORF Transcript_65297/g.181056 Transcript_65297/m.181056 type:complete len:98 (-) Transcript_65297:250-543(-)
MSLARSVDYSLEFSRTFKTERSDTKNIHARRLARVVRKVYKVRRTACLRLLLGLPPLDGGGGLSAKPPYRPLSRRRITASDVLQAHNILNELLTKKR